MPAAGLVADWLTSVDRPANMSRTRCIRRHQADAASLNILCIIGLDTIVLRYKNASPDRNLTALSYLLRRPDTGGAPSTGELSARPERGGSYGAAAKAGVAR